MFKGHPHTSPEAVQDIKLRHVRSRQVTSQLIEFCRRATDTHGSTSAARTRTQNHVFYLSQAKYWNPSVNEVEGVVTDRKGNVIHNLFGKWHEAVYCGKPPSATCIWRASMTGFFINASIKSLCGMVRVFFLLSVCAMQRQCQ